MATVVTVAGKGSPLSATEMDANFSNLNTDKLDDAPSDGTQYIRENGSWANLAADSFIETSSTKPSNPIDGQPWFSESNGVTYVYDSTSGDWSAIGTPADGSGRRALRSLEGVSISSLADKEALSYNSSAGTWGNTKIGESVSGHLSASPTTLGSGVWLLDIRMSIGYGTWTSSFPYQGTADITVQTYADTGSYANQWRTEQPYLTAGSWSYKSLYVTSNYAANSPPISGAVIKLVEVSNAYQIKAGISKQYLSCSASAMLVATKVGDV